MREELGPGDASSLSWFCIRLTQRSASPMQFAVYFILIFYYIQSLPRRDACARVKRRRSARESLFNALALPEKTDWSCSRTKVVSNFPPSRFESANDSNLSSFSAHDRAHCVCAKNACERQRPAPRAAGWMSGIQVARAARGLRSQSFYDILCRRRMLFEGMMPSDGTKSKNERRTHLWRVSVSTRQPSAQTSTQISSGNRSRGEWLAISCRRCGDITQQRPMRAAID